MPAGNCFCDKIEFGYAAHNVLSAAHTLTNLFAWGCGDASVRMCSGLAELSAPRISVDEEGLVTEEKSTKFTSKKNQEMVVAVHILLCCHGREPKIHTEQLRSSCAN